MSRLTAYVVGLGTLCAVAAPGFGNPTHDSYPLSTYPMFARPRGRPLLHFVEGLDESGRSRRLPPELVAGDEVMQAAASVRRAAQRGAPAMERFCRAIAARAARSASYAALREIALVRARFDPLEYFLERPEPEERVTLFRCAVGGGAP